MRCPKCGYHSFDHLESCKKCGNDLGEFKSRFNLGSLFQAGIPARKAAVAAEPAPSPVVEAPAAEAGDDGFDFTEAADGEETALQQAGEKAPAAEEDPFGFDESWGEVGDLTAGVPQESGGEPDGLDADPFALDLEETPPAAGDDAPPLEMATAVGDETPLADWDIFAESEPEPTAENPRSAGEEPADPFDQGESLPAEGTPVIAPAETDAAAVSGAAHPAEKEEPEVEAEESAPTGEILFASLPGGEAVAVDPVSAAAASPVEEAEEEVEPSPTADGDEPAQPAEPPLSPRPESVSSATPVPQRGGTATGAEAPLPPGSLGGRLGATFVDLLLLAVLFCFFLLAGGLVLHPQAGPGLDMVLALSSPYFLVLFTLCFGYFTLFHFLTGQTPGKMLFRIRVEDGAGGELSFAQAFLRSTGGLASLLAVGLGYLVIPFDRRRRGWNDRFAGTCLVAVGDSSAEPVEEGEAA